MLKHPKITAERIQQFLKHTLGPSLNPASAALKIEFCGEPFATESEAKKGEFQEVGRGYRYGPAYRTVWFRVSGRVPKDMAGHPIGIVLDIGSEKTIWKSNSPWMGVDDEHKVCPLIEKATGNEKAELYIQAYTRNPQCRVHLRELPREELVEQVEEAKIVTIDEPLKQLYYDVDFGYSLMSAFEDSDVSKAVLMRALNYVCNTYDPRNRDSIARCSKHLRDAFLNLNGDIRHTVTACGHAHLDTAWLWPLEITKKKMAHTTATQLSLMERYEDFVYVHSQASQYEWLEKEYPALFKRVKEAISRGQWEPVGSMWVEADCNLTGSEALVRQFLYGRKYFQEKLGVTTDDMFLPDVFGYSGALPQILNKFNIGYFITQKISWNQINKFPHNTFYWQGIDGSKIWSHFPPADTYCGDGTPKEILESVRKHRDHARSDHSLYLFGFGDGGGGPTERHIELLRRSQIATNMPDVLTGRKANDFYREAKAKSKDLNTWVGELYFEYHRGTYTSQAANKKHNRYCEFLLRDAEMLCCFRDDFPKGYPAAELERIWKLVLLNQFHDIIPGSSVNEVYRDSDRDYADIRESGEKIVAETMQRMGAKFDTSGMDQPVALFQNAVTPTLSYLPWSGKGEGPQSIQVGGESLPVQVVDRLGEPMLAMTTPLAALGAVAVGDLSDGAPSTRYRLKASNRKIENSFFSVRFDPHGNITSIESLEDGTEFIAAGRLANLFQLLDDKPMFWSAWDVDVYALETAKDLIKSESFEIVERGPVRVAAQIVKRFGNSTIKQKIILGSTPMIFFETEIDWHEEDKMLKVAFPCNVNAQRATYEIQFGNVERPTHYNTTWDLARFEVCAQKWADLSEGDHGVAILNDGKYGHDINGNVMRLSLLRSPKAPDPECDMGVHKFTYALMPHFGPYNYAGVVSAAYAHNAPLRHAFLSQGKGTNGELPPLVNCEDRNVVIESVKKAEDGNGIIVRLYECHNSRGSAELICARTPSVAWLCNLEERPEKELEIHEGMVLFDYKPFEIITIRLDV